MAALSGKVPSSCQVSEIDFTLSPLIQSRHHLQSNLLHSSQEKVTAPESNISPSEFILSCYETAFINLRKPLIFHGNRRKEMGYLKKEKGKGCMEECR